MTTEHYLPRHLYDALVRKLAALPDQPTSDRENEIKIALGEFGDIWPETIKPLIEGQEAA